MRRQPTIGSVVFNRLGFVYQRFMMGWVCTATNLNDYMTWKEVLNSSNNEVTVVREGWDGLVTA